MWELLICSIISGTLYPCAQASSDLSIEDSIIYLREKIKQMDLLLKRTEERNEELSGRLSEVEKVLEKERSTIERLEIKEYLTRELITSHVDSHREVQVLIQDNITSSAEKLRLHIQESSLGFENIESNFNNKMRSFENSLLKIEKDYANVSNISKVNESLLNLDKTVKDGFQSIQTELDPRVKRLEEKKDLRDNVTEIENTLRNHNSKISEFDTLFVDIQNSCFGEPPSVQNGAPVSFERKNNSIVRYECNRKFVLSGDSTVRCKSGKWDGKPPVCSYFDVSFYLERYSDRYIACYKDENAEQIEFSQLGKPGQAESLPMNSSSIPSGIRVDFSVGQYGRGFGVFQCRFNEEGRSMEIAVASQNLNRPLHFPQSSKYAVVGDTVELQTNPTMDSYLFNGIPKWAVIKWKHNGMIVPSWDNKSNVEIQNVQPSDAGIYERYHEGYEARGFLHGYMRLIVRRCKANMYGKRCDQTCPPCYNGGICHDLLGICVCPDGFIGRNCETACPVGFHGGNCSTECVLENCMTLVFCKPDPYGCSCARGFKGLWCNDSCDPGWYGADCKQQCNCANGPDSCNKFTGACSGGCSSGRTGESCQIEAAG